AERSWQRGAGRPGPDTPPAGDGWAPRRLSPLPPARSGVRLTGRGAVLLMVAAFALGLLAQAVTGWAALAGLGFAAGAAAAARFTKPADLLTVAVTPPLVFFCVLLVFTGVSATGNVLH